MPCLPVPPRNPFRIGIPVAAAPAAALGGTSLDEVSPAATAMVAAPGPDPVTADKVATLERNALPRVTFKELEGLIGNLDNERKKRIIQIQKGRSVESVVVEEPVK